MVGKSISNHIKWFTSIGTVLAIMVLYQNCDNSGFLTASSQTACINCGDSNSGSGSDSTCQGDFCGEILQSEFSWALVGGGIGDDYSRGAACDSQGRCLASGDLHNADGVFGLFDVTFGGQNRTLENSPTSPFISYLIGFSPSGVAENPTFIPGFASVDIDTQSDGMVIVAGRIVREIQTKAGALTPSIGGGDAAFIAVDRAGDFVFGSAFGGDGTDTINEISTGQRDQILVTGPFGQGTRPVKDMIFPDKSVASFIGGDQDIFLAQFSAKGAFEWGVGIWGNGHEEGRGVSSLKDGKVLLCGEFDTELHIGSQVLQAEGGQPDIFVAVFSEQGQPLWARRFGASGRDACRGVDPGMTGQLIISGEFTNQVDFDGHKLVAHGNNDSDIFVVSLDVNSGQVVKAMSFGSQNNDIGCEVETSTQYLWCAGSGAADISIAGKTITTSRDQFLLRMNLDLDPLDIIGLGGQGATTNFAVGLAPNGSGILVGTISGGAEGANGLTLTAANPGNDFYVLGFQSLWSSPP